MAELVDALASEASGRKAVGVRLPLWVLYIAIILAQVAELVDAPA